MRNRQISTRPLSVLAFCLLMGLYGPEQMFAGPWALADGPNPGADIPVASATTQTDPALQLNTLFKHVETVVKKFYPRATIAISDSKIHIEYKCKSEESFYTQRTVLAPQAGGILCDITLKPGQYKGEDKDRLPSEVQDGFHTNLTMAPYSKQQDKHLLMILSFPADIDVQFKEHFKKLINSFDAKELAAEAAATKAAAEEATRKAAADKAAKRAALEQARKAAADNHELTYGAATMSTHQFPEGRFRALLPDTFETNHSAQINLAKVDYSSQGEQGCFTVSYLVMPAAVGVADANSLFAKVAASMIQQVGGGTPQQAFTTLKGCPGRQIMLSSIKAKPASGALMRIYIAGNYLYELTAVGEKSWLDSPAVNDFMNSFEFFGGWGRWYDAQNLEHWQDASGLEHWRGTDGQEHWWDASHQERSQ
jgi:hypothetical protein